jgi:thiamine-phosphate pyrophosphorylase
MPKHSIADCRLYGFIDTGYLAGRDPAELTRQLIAGGVDIIQVRAKKLSRSKLVALAKAVVQAAKDTPVPVIVNDDHKVAQECGADGVHLGQDDWAKLPRETRSAELLSIETLGLSTHSFPQAMFAEREGANYIGVGPIHATGTKPGREPVGYELLRQVTGRIHVPYFAIGGITLTNLDQVLACGATRIAVVSAILKAPDVTKAAAEFKKRLP